MKTVIVYCDYTILHACYRTRWTERETEKNCKPVMEEKGKIGIIMKQMPFFYNTININSKLRRTTLVR